MKKENVFRYTLQFPANTVRQGQVGELLERLGSKKSRFIVMVLGEYLQSHPEIIDHKTQICFQDHQPSGYSREELKEIILQILNESGLKTAGIAEIENNENSGVGGLDAMLDSLGAFFK